MPWMSYDEAAERLCILPASVKRQARARKWPRRIGNDGRAQVDVPADRLAEAPPSPALPVSSPDDAPGSPPLRSGYEPRNAGRRT